MKGKELGNIFWDVKDICPVYLYFGIDGRESKRKFPSILSVSRNFERKFERCFHCYQESFLLSIILISLKIKKTIRISDSLICYSSLCSVKQLTTFRTTRERLSFITMMIYIFALNFIPNLLLDYWINSKKMFTYVESL